MITSTSCIVQEIVNEREAPKFIRFLDLNYAEKSEATKSNAAAQDAKKELITRFAVMVSYFIRSSWLEKKKFLQALMKKLESLNSIGIIINSIIVFSTTATIYSCAQYSTNFVYDTALVDHNRSLCPKTLAKLQEVDIKWYSTLGDLDKVLIFVGLVRSTGGLLAYQIYRELRKWLRQTLEIRRSGILEYDYSTPIPNLLASQVPSSLLKSKTPIMYEEFQGYDSNNPYLIETQKLRKNWDTMISKYKEQVEGKPQKEAKEKEKKGKDKKGKEKKGEKEKKSNQPTYEDVDEIQILPFWIIMMIFDYLDNKTLKKISSVNSYWVFAVSEVQKIRKARKAIDKVIQQMKQKINSGQMDKKYRLPAKKNFKDGDLPKKRLIALSRRGAVISKLCPKHIDHLYTSAFITDALRQIPGNYVLPVASINTFPRDFDLSNVPSLFKPASCIINELGFSKLKKPLTYSDISVAINDIFNTEYSPTISGNSSVTQLSL